jgi:SAM-dependent methyltransferase
MAINQRMREDWDSRARANAMHYIDTRRGSWEATSFFEAGRAEALALVRPALDHLRFEPHGKRILEIGCGVGRLFPGFAELFGEVWGIDVSPEMVRQARAVCPVPQARFLIGSGQDLCGVEDNSIDYCFSYIVFQHVPDARVLWSYLTEIRRVLRSGGAFQLHFRSDRPLKSRAFLLLPARARRAVKRMRSQVLPGDTSTWTGVAVTPAQVIGRLTALGMRELEVLPCQTFSHQSFWAVGRQP